MILLDDEIFLILLVLAIFFMILASNLPLQRFHDQTIEPIGFAVIIMYWRGLTGLIFSGLFWAMLSLYSFTLNNCSGIFNACFTNPQMSATTITTYISPFALPLGFAFAGLSIMTFVVAFTVIMYEGFGIYIYKRGWAAQRQRQSKKTNESDEEIESLA